MKKLTLFAIGFLLSMTLTTGTANAAAIDIVFDGYCDGAHLNYNMATGLADGYQTGCAQGLMLGTAANIFGQGAGLSMGFDALADGVGYFFIIRANRTVTVYYNDGTGIIVLNEAAWSYGVAGASATGTTPLASK